MPVRLRQNALGERGRRRGISSGRRYADGGPGHGAAGSLLAQNSAATSSLWQGSAGPIRSPGRLPPRDESTALRPRRRPKARRDRPTRPALRPDPGPARRPGDRLPSPRDTGPADAAPGRDRGYAAASSRKPVARRRLAVASASRSRRSSSRPSAWCAAASPGSSSDGAAKGRERGGSRPASTSDMPRSQYRRAAARRSGVTPCRASEAAPARIGAAGNADCRRRYSSALWRRRPTSVSGPRLAPCSPGPGAGSGRGNKVEAGDFAVSARAAAAAQQRLNLRPLPQGQGSLRRDRTAAETDAGRPLKVWPADRGSPRSRAAFWRAQPALAGRCPRAHTEIGQAMTQALRFRLAGFGRSDGRRINEAPEPVLAQARGNRHTPRGQGRRDCRFGETPSPLRTRPHCRRRRPEAERNESAGRTYRPGRRSTRAQPRRRRRIAANAASAEPSTASEPGSGTGVDRSHKWSLQSNGK